MVVLLAGTWVGSAAGAAQQPGLSLANSQTSLAPVANCLPAHRLLRQVHIVSAALHSHPGLLRLTYYPKMPGNSTAKPEEKWLHQRRAMTEEAAVHAFRSAKPFDCAATTLAAFVEEQGLERIDLLKVRVPFVFGVILCAHAKNFYRRWQA